MFSWKNMIFKIVFRNAQEELGHAPHHYICFRGEFSSKMDSILSESIFWPRQEAVGVSGPWHSHRRKMFKHHVFSWKSWIFRENHGLPREIRDFHENDDFAGNGTPETSIKLHEHHSSSHRWQKGPDSHDNMTISRSLVFFCWNDNNSTFSMVSVQIQALRARRQNIN